MILKNSRKKSEGFGSGRGPGAHIQHNATPPPPVSIVATTVGMIQPPAAPKDPFLITKGWERRTRMQNVFIPEVPPAAAGRRGQLPFFQTGVFFQIG